MQKCKTKSFTQVYAYSSTFLHIQAQSGIIQENSGIFRTLCNHGVSPWCNRGIFRTLVYLEQEAYLEAWYIQNKMCIQNLGIMHIPDPRHIEKPFKHPR